MSLMPRFAILEHVDAPDDPAGRHFDLLIEAGESCRTWRLARLPDPGGPPVAAVELSPHRLAWLDHEAGEVSGGRGFARRLDAGDYDLAASDAADIRMATRLVFTCAGSVLRGPLEVVFTAHAWSIAAS